MWTSRRLLQSFLKRGCGLGTNDVNTETKLATSDGLEHLDGTLGVVAIDLEVSSNLDEALAALCEIGDGCDLEACELRELYC